MTIGRMKGNTIALDDSSVSLSHAKITRLNGEFFLKDLNSTNGTMLNGQSINEARLRDGDQVKIGEVIAYYRAEPAFGPAGSAPAQTVGPSSQIVAPLALAQSPPPPPVSTASATFVSKRLVTQSTPPPPPQTTASNLPATSSSTSRIKKANKQSRLIPVLASCAVLAAVAVLGWIFVSGNQKNNKPVASPPFPANSSSPKITAMEGQASAPKPAMLKPQISSSESSLAELIPSLKSPDLASRRKAAAELHSLGPGAKEALPQLREALNDSDADVRMWSALALINNKSYDKGTIPVLIQVLHHDNSMFRQVACLSLALIPYSDAEKEIVVNSLRESAGKDADEEVRKSAISALKIIAPDSVPTDK